MIFIEKLAPADIIKFEENKACVPSIKSDDVFTRWSIKTELKHVLGVCEAWRSQREVRTNCSMPLASDPYMPSLSECLQSWQGFAALLYHLQELGPLQLLWRRNGCRSYLNACERSGTQKWDAIGRRHSKHPQNPYIEGKELWSGREWEGDVKLVEGVWKRS